MKRFKSTSGTPIRIALLSGHVAWVQTEWTDLQERFWSEAYSLGCISEDMIKNTSMSQVDHRVLNTLNNIALQKNEVEDAIRRLVKENKLDDFDKNGKPKSSVLTTMVGFRVTNSMRDEVWYRVQEQSNDAS